MTRRTVQCAAIILLAIGCVIAYWPALHNGFTRYDDDEYITQNPYVLSGLTPQGILWAFTSSHACNWHPLTWVSHMLDCQLFGLNAAAHHAVSIGFHTVNCVLLLLLLWQLTGAFWPSLVAAAFFGLHPMHVESVAWAAERKDVLSAFFWMLTSLSYVSYVRRPNRALWLSTLALFACGLMSKSMLVTLPCVLIMLDYWPLGRFEEAAERPAVIRLLARSAYEKGLLFILACASAIVTLVVQSMGGATRTLEILPLDVRIKNALVSYVLYAWQLVWPENVPVCYPHPADTLPGWQVIVATGILAAVTLLVLASVRKAPYLAVGWGWYVVTLLPVIGIVQVGNQGLAARYTYIPSIGLSIAVVWGLAALARPSRIAQRGLLAAALAAAVILGVRTHTETRVWHDDESLFRESLRVSPEHNAPAHYNLGCELFEQGRDEEAVEEFTTALRWAPGHPKARVNLAIALNRMGRVDEAERELRTALDLNPEDANAWMNLGVIFLGQKRLDDALTCLKKAVSIDPLLSGAQYNLGIVMMNLNRLEEAVVAFTEAIKSPNARADCHFQLARALGLLGRTEEGIQQLRRALDVDPGHTAARRLLAGQLMKNGALSEAAQQYQALANGPDGVPDDLVNLGMILASLGRLPEAQAALATAVQRDPNNIPARFNLAAVLLQSQAFDQAAGEFAKILEKNPADADAHYGLGIAMLQMGRAEEARNQFEETVRLKPDHAAAKAEWERLRDTK